MNWPVLIITGILLLSLILFLVIRNQKDKKTVERQLKDDYRKSKDSENEDIGPEDLPK